MSNESTSHRGTIHVESAKILSHERFPGDQFVLRVAAPKCAAKARPGSFVHLRTDPMLRMRRPLSIMRVDAKEGWVDMLYKVVGEGTRLLSERQEGESLSLMGPIGKPFVPHPERPRALLLGGGVGIPPMVFLAEQLRRENGFDPLVLMGSEVPFPFRARPSEIMVPGIPEGVIAAMPLMEDWDIASRLASLQGYPGVFEGYITDLARGWLQALDEDQRARVEIFACGPHPMLAATAKLAREFDLPCQVSLEEFMACAVGGCAGCVVEVQEDSGPAMRRVCVDGPVFDAARVFV
ncbi:MAG: dihydroorotate dehydrogenase electron transfer subunit [Gammaproteobacteria bacterium]|nr:dihydroorotate dehydrogenase electron transfer subunit [Gammaproteobacteria bacterium]